MGQRAKMRNNFVIALLLVYLVAVSSGPYVRNTSHKLETVQNDTYDDALHHDHPSHPHSESGDVTDDFNITATGLEYIEEELSNFKAPVLKHYSVTDDLAFYPAFSYEGFFNPPEWHNIPIEYFTQPGNTSKLSTDMKRAIEEHRSAMSLCTEQVISVIEEVKDPFSDEKEMCWGSIWNECRSSTPSPIDILTEEATLNKTLTDFVFTNFDVPYPAIMFLPEDGTDLLTLKFVTSEIDEAPGISGGVVGDQEVYLDRILFRVGYHADEGSEHMIDESVYGMEIQLFFAPKNLSYWEALAQYKLMKPNDPQIGRNVHALSVLVKIAPENPVAKYDDEDEYPPKFEILSLGAQKFWSSKNPKMWRGISFKDTMFSLQDFLSGPLDGSYYTYEGSMTHPPCLSHLIWTVFETPVWMKHEQWKRFKYVHSEFSDDQFLEGNFRDFSDIIVKANVETYQKMKNYNAEGFIEQHELDEAIRDEDASKRGEPALFTSSYDKYRAYFAKRVMKGFGRRKRNWSEYDYEGLINERDHGSTTAPMKLLIASITIAHLLIITFISLL